MSRIVCGIHPVRELLRARPGEVERLHFAPGAGRGVGELLALARETGVRGRPAEPGLLARLAAGAAHQGIVAEVTEYRYSELADLLAPGGQPPLVLFLDGIEDPRNLGAIVRSADALGARGIVVPQDRAAGVTATAAKASAGAIERCPVARTVNLARAIEEAKKAGLWAVAAAPDGERPIWEVDLTGPMALVIGAEGRGIRPLVRRHCDLSVRIPMAVRAGSLNAAAAAAIVLYEVKRQRRPEETSAAPAKGSRRGLDTVVEDE